jgi:hypothetical protein
MIATRTAFAIAFYRGTGFPTENTENMATTLRFTINKEFRDRTRFRAVLSNDHAIGSACFVIFEGCIASGALDQGTQASRRQVIPWPFAKAARIAEDNAGAGLVIDPFCRRETRMAKQRMRIKGLFLEKKRSL